MGQAREDCPVCGRRPGTPHLPVCTRLGVPHPRVNVRPVYPGKGPFTIRERADGIAGRFFGKTKETTYLNPGVPMVRAPKLRTAGGVPQRYGTLTKEELAAAIASFMPGGKFEAVGR